MEFRPFAVPLRRLRNQTVEVGVHHVVDRGHQAGGQAVERRIQRGVHAFRCLKSEESSNMGAKSRGSRHCPSGPRRRRCLHPCGVRITATGFLLRDRVRDGAREHHLVDRQSGLLVVGPSRLQSTQARWVRTRSCSWGSLPPRSSAQKGWARWTVAIYQLKGTNVIHLHLPWARGLGGEHEKQLRPVTVLDVVMVLSVLVAVIAFSTWFVIVKPARSAWRGVRPRTRAPRSRGLGSAQIRRPVAKAGNPPPGSPSAPVP